ncbi:MAG TPA: ABC transporter permease [Acidimicrobiales bacterium]|nr:ABC transporter permease [Acidimicrobiales bacterium]
MFYVQVALLGIIVGCVYALSATGVVLTYSATGVFNIAHFAIGLLAGYLAWQANGVWGLPLVLTVPLVLVVCGPLLGLVLERVVFRPLQQARASSSEKLVAALGVTVVVLALINVVWGPGVQGTVDEPVPRLFPLTSFEVGPLIFDQEQIGTLLVTLLVAGTLYVLLRRTMLGIRIRAVVDRRELAQLSAIDADRVSQVAWGLGCTIAALTGLIITQGTLEPTRIIYLGIETFSVAVVARLVSIPVALAFGFGVMGLGRSLLDAFEPFGATGGAADTYQAVVTNLSSIVLFAALVVYRRLDEVGGDGSRGSGLALGRFGRNGVTGATVGARLAALAALVAVPFVLDGADLRAAHTFLALAVIFVSIVAITGFSGHLTLGQASIAGLGAFASARFTNAFDLPVLVAMVPGALVAVLAGLVAGYPALRRRGLFLGLTTLGLALIIDRFVFNEQLFQGGPGGLTVTRPTVFGIDLRGDVAFWFYEAAVLALALFVARNLRTGRLGRVLGAMRDSDVGAESVGIDLRRAKLFVFGVSSAMAGIGGALLTQANQSWDTTTFNPVLGLFWFTAVVVCGVSSTGGALLAALLYVGVPQVLGLDVQSAVGIFGIGAVLIGRSQGGLVAQLERLRVAVPRRLDDEYRAVLARRRPAPVPPLPLSAFGARILQERARR